MLDESPKKFDLTVSGLGDGLDIFVNGIAIGERTPAQISVEAGDLIYTSGVFGFAGAWVVDGSEKYLRFSKEEFSDGYRIYADVGSGWRLVGYELSRRINQAKFDELALCTEPLRMINASFCLGVSSVLCLSAQSELWALSLLGTEVSDISPIANLCQLRWLELSKTKVIDISPLANLRELKELHISDTRVSDVSPLANLHNLTSLRLGRTLVSDITPLAKLRGLKMLGLWKTNVPEDDIKWLKEKLPNCEIIFSPSSVVRPKVLLKPKTKVDLGKKIREKTEKKVERKVEAKQPVVEAQKTLEVREVKELTLEVIGPREGLDVFVNGVSSQGKTPAKVNVKPNDLVLVCGSVMGVRSVQGVRNISGDERYIKFKVESHQNIYKLYSDTGSGWHLLGYDFTGLASQIVFDELMGNMESIRLVEASRCKGIFSLSLLSTKSELWALNLSGTEVSNLSPLAKIKGLKWLDIGRTRVNNIAPLANLGELIALYLGWTPVSDISPLANMSELRLLDLWRTQILDISPIANLLKLEKLFLGYAQISSLEPLLNLRNLKELNLSKTQVFNIKPLAKLSGLKILNLEGTRVSDISPLKDLTELEILRLSYTQVSDISPLENHHRLKELDLSFTNVSDISPLANMKSLEKLYLRSTPVASVSALANLQNLKELHLTDTRVSDISALADLRGLKVLWLMGCEVSDSDLDWLKKRIPTCEIVKEKGTLSKRLAGLFFKITSRFK